MRIQAVTICISNLEVSRRFYEEILGFEPDAAYERWQSYQSEGRAFLGIMEVPGFVRAPSQDIINIIVADVNGLWARIRDRVAVESPPTMMPWGTYKMVILDPDGYRIGLLDDR